jgi:hypothetical protein
MKIIKCLVCLVFFLAAFCAGCFIFAPRDEAGKLALAYARLAASQQGFYMTYEEFSGSGIFNPSYRITGLDLEGPMAKITFSDLQATVYPLSSLISRSARTRVQFKETGVLLVGGNSLSLKSGEMDISAAGALVSVTDANVEGDIRLTGDITFDIGGRAITESTAAIQVPPLINAFFSTRAAAPFVEQMSPGEWRVKKSAR